MEGTGRRSADVSALNAKYIAQRAYNAHRGKRGYEVKPSRRDRHGS
jgi:hypothetical protein